MAWGSKTIRGTVYDLRHLNPVKLVVLMNVESRQYRVQIEFGAHTFTTEHHPSHSPDLIVQDGKAKRTFCLHRYSHSLHLKAAIEQAIKGDVYLSDGKTVICTTLPGLVGPYLVAFKLETRRRLNADAILTVVSAHHRPNFSMALPKVRFTVLLSSTVAGYPVRWTKK